MLSEPEKGGASAVSLGNQGRTDLALGQRVFHGKFGYGTIAAIEGNKLEIDFEHSGRKKVLDSFSREQEITNYLALYHRLLSAQATPQENRASAPARASAG